ncbi:MAG: hypothetical protein GY835_09125, partial [bacterium]|nr:hypothetical protein [bacterium]
MRKVPPFFRGVIYGKLGDGTTTEQHVPVQVSGLMEVTAMAAGQAHSLALKSDGTVWAWGNNAFGQLGDGTTTDRHTPVQVSGLAGITAIAGGYFHSLALKSDGTVWAWGNNAHGELGDGTTTNRHIPVQVSGLTGVTAIAGGQYHSLALKSDGTVWAWGNNYTGQLGDGTTTDRYTPVQVSGLTGVTAIAGGYFHSLALKSDGTVWAWGDNDNGELGDGTTTIRLTPVQVSSLTGVIAIAGGSNHHGLALKSDGTVWAWGYNAYGQLGDGTTTSRSSPVQVSGLTGVTVIAGGSVHSLALKSDGTVWAWGKNGYGQLGDGTTTDRSLPAQVSGLTGVIAIAAGGYHNLALKATLALITNLTASPGSPEVYPGDPVSVDLDIQGANDLYAAQATCTVDPAILEPQSGVFGGFFDPINRIVAANEVDAVAGTWFGAISQQNPAGPLSGNGLFATITYEALIPGITAITCDPLFSDRDGFTQTVTFTGASVTVLPFGTISGTATYQGRLDHAGIAVAATGIVTSTDTTDSAGAFALGQLKAHTYTVEADAASYLPSCAANVVVA